jgi:hypothetical protein
MAVVIKHGFLVSYSTPVFVKVTTTTDGDYYC